MLPSPGPDGGRVRSADAPRAAPAVRCFSGGRRAKGHAPRRAEPSFLLDEREMLEAWLAFHRTSLVLKCEGLEDHARKVRPVATSKLSLDGLVRH
jgi:Protein of unknown function (DUF664)